ncbi:unnamed protein product [Ixodes hexagonus]
MRSCSCVEFSCSVQCLTTKMRKTSVYSPRRLQYWLRAFHDAGIDTDEAKASLNHILASVVGRRGASEMWSHGTERSHLSAPQVKRIDEYCEKRAARLPVQYILGQWDFHNITLKMRPPIFIPRPETENLVDIVLSHLRRTSKSSRVLDIGCGTGAICLALANAAQICCTGVDKNPEAVKLAKENAANLNLAQYATFHEAEISSHGMDTAHSPLLNQVYDVIVSNPPYISTEEEKDLEPEILRYEDNGALFAGPSGLDVVQNILRFSRTNLRVWGHLFLEVGLAHPPLIHSILRTPEYAQLFRLLAVHSDFTLRDRFVEIKRIE